MAKQVKVLFDEINTISSEIGKKLEELNGICNEIENNKVLIAESWKSAGAMGTVKKIDGYKTDMEKAIKEIKNAEKIVKKTSQKILDADTTIRINLGRSFY